MNFLDLLLNPAISSALLSIILTVIGVLYTIRYSSVYHVNEPNRTREKYVVIEKPTLASKTDHQNSCRIALQKSSIDNAQGFMDVVVSDDVNSVKLARYAFIHSCNHALIAPGLILLDSTGAWSEDAPSNGFKKYKIHSKELTEIPFNLAPETIRKKAQNLKCVESLFEYPGQYTGPHYKRRLLIYARGIGIVYGEMEYTNQDRDVYVLRKYNVGKGSQYWFPYNNIGNYWVYDVNFNPYSDPKTPKSINMR